MSVTTNRYTSIAKERRQILKDAQSLLTEYDYGLVKEELNELPRAYGAYGAELIYRGDKLIMFRTIRTVGQTAEAFIEGDRGLSKRT